MSIADPDEMLRVLFVDDEQALLDGLERALFLSAPENWECDFYNNGPEALEAAEDEAYDVIVSDMRMPGMDGATLLREFAKAHPETLRIILTGHTELEQAMRAVQVAHQFLSKPITPDELVGSVGKGVELLACFTNPVVVQVAGAIEHLPSRPGTYARLVAALAREATCAADVAKIVEEDPSIAAELLRVANSAFFGGRVKTGSVQQAAMRLGFNTVKDIVLATESLSKFDVPAASVERISTHGVQVAAIAKSLVQGKENKEDVFAAGLLHDVGRLLLAWRFPDKDFLTSELNDSETEVGATHMEVGAYLLGMWGMPFSLVNAVRYHHEPDLGGIHAWPLMLADTAVEHVTLAREPSEKLLAYLTSHGKAELFELARAKAREVLTAA